VTPPEIGSISPFFIVKSVARSIPFYRDGLGFDVTFQEGPPPDPFFAIVRRGGAMIFMKGSGDSLPNPQRYSWARWDAYLFVPDPDALASELAGRGVTFKAPLKDTHDGLRGFEVTDPDGYVLFLGRPRQSPA
jgi:catechol 2,3-dioxygenase-like lactoylglutathione lyase family enzyme